MNLIKSIFLVSIFGLLVVIHPVELKKCIRENNRETISIKDELPQPESCQANDCKVKKNN